MLRVVLKDGNIVLPPETPMEDVVEAFRTIFTRRERKTYTCPFGGEHD
jgi:hypothetical protein